MPNTSVRAAAEGMPNVNRRTALLGATAAALAATAVTFHKAESTEFGGAGASSTGKDAQMNMINHEHFQHQIAEPADHPDAALFALEKEFAAAERVMKRAVKASVRADKKMEKAAGPRPIMPHVWEEQNKMPDDLREMRATAMQHIRFGEAMSDEWWPEPVKAFVQARSEERDKVKAAWEAYGARIDECSSRFDCERLEKEYDDRHNELWVIGYRIFEMPANTIEGMAVKLRVGEALDTHHCEENEAWASLAEDVTRLSRVAA